MANLRHEFIFSQSLAKAIGYNHAYYRAMAASVCVLPVNELGGSGSGVGYRTASIPARVHIYCLVVRVSGGGF